MLNPLLCSISSHLVIPSGWGLRPVLEALRRCHAPRGVPGPGEDVTAEDLEIRSWLLRCGAWQVASWAGPGPRIATWFGLSRSATVGLRSGKKPSLGCWVGWTCSCCLGIDPTNPEIYKVLPVRPVVQEPQVPRINPLSHPNLWHVWVTVLNPTSPLERSFTGLLRTVWNCQPWYDSLVIQHCNGAIRCNS